MRFRNNKKHGIPHGVCFEADTMFWYSFKILPDRLKLIRLYPCGSLGQSVSFVFGARVGHFAVTPQSDEVGIWSRDLGVMATLSVRQKMPFFVCIYNPQITVSPTSLFSASFNENHVKNHPEPWTCSLKLRPLNRHFKLDCHESTPQYTVRSERCKATFSPPSPFTSR